MSNSAITGPVFSDVRRSPSGSAAAPSWSFADATGTGVYLASTDVLALSTAGVQRVVVDAAGKVGIGTASPGSKLDVSSGSSGVVLNLNGVNAYDAETGITLSQGRAKISGYLNTTGGTPGSSLRFYTMPDNGSISERMRIDGSGNLLVGTTSTANSTPGARILNAVNGPFFQSTRADSTNASATYVVYSSTAATTRFYVGFAGTVFATNTTITSLSDQRFKENIRDLDDGLASVMALKPRKFDWKEGKGKDIKNDRGFIAQEFEQVFPDLIDTWKDPAPEGEEPYKAVNANLIPTLVKAIQELKAELDEAKAKIVALEAK